MNVVAELFADPAYCLEEAMRCRQAFCTREATHKERDAAMDSLLFNVLHCPEEIKDQILSIQQECDLRLRLIGRLAAKQL